MSEDNKAIFRRFIDEVINPGDSDQMDKFVATDYIYNGVHVGSEGYRQNHMSIRAAFPDFHVAIERIIGDDDIVAVDMIWSGTHTGRYRGIEPTGKHVAWRSTQFRRFANGMAAEGWGANDTMGLLRQLGANLDQFESG